jgi:uncharacterized protein
MTPHESSLAPVSAGERIETLDVLRGFAVLGILIMNIQSFTMPSAAYFFPVAYGDLHGPNYWVWYLSELFARRKMMTIFSILFGAGIVLMRQRAIATGRGSAALHYRRMGALWFIGMLHAYLLWDGDILVTYAVCGLLLFLFSKVRPGRLVIAALIFLAVGSGLSFLAGLTAPSWPPADLEAFRNDWQPSEVDLAEEIAAMRGGWWEEILHRYPSVMQIQLFFVPFHMFWRACGCMLLGMALFKWGLLSGLVSRTVYAVTAVVCLLVGIPLTALTIHLQFESGWEPVYSFFLGNQPAYWGAVPMAVGYVCLVALLFHAKRSWLTTRLAAVGRMAFTNYLLQTILCTTLMYGRGFGLFGSVDRVFHPVIVIGVWVLQLWYSPIWLRHFRFGPAEWFWRSLSYRSRQPMRRMIDSQDIAGTRGG